jgi:hypothetical protein
VGSGFRAAAAFMISVLQILMYGFHAVASFLGLIAFCDTKLKLTCVGKPGLRTPLSRKPTFAVSKARRGDHLVLRNPVQPARFRYSPMTSQAGSQARRPTNGVCAHLMVSWPLSVRARGSEPGPSHTSAQSGCAPGGDPEGPASPSARSNHCSRALALHCRLASSSSANG